MPREGSLFAVVGLLVAGCADATPPPPPPIVEEIVEAVPALTEEAEVPRQLELSEISAELTNDKPPRLRWRGHVRVLDDYGGEHNLLIKTVCSAGGVTLSDVGYASVEDRDSALGIPVSGTGLAFRSLADTELVGVERTCEMQMRLVERDTGKISAPLPSKACFANGSASLGACDPQLPSYPREFSVQGMKFDPETRMLRHVVTLGDYLASNDRMVLRSTCVKRGRPEHFVGTTLGMRSFGVLEPGDAGADYGFVPSAVFSDAEICRFAIERWRPGHYAHGFRIYGKVDFPDIVHVGDRCWRRGEGFGSCASFPPKPAWHADTDVSLSADVSWGGPGGSQLILDGALVVIRPSAVHGDVNVRARCRGPRVERTLSLPSTAPPFGLHAGEALPVVGLLSLGVDRPASCRVDFTLEADDESVDLVSACLDRDGPVPCETGP